MKRFLGLWFGLFLAVPLSVQSADPAAPDARQTARAAEGDPAWKLVWADEFDGAGLPDAARWDYEVGMVRNNEAQFYTRARTENTRVEEGRLVIEARKEPFEKAQYTAGSLRTRQSWKYGRIEVRAKIPTGRGMWPAIWMLPDGMRGGWPACGEIDIMENVGYDPDLIHGTVHTKAYNHTQGTQKGKQVRAKAPYDDFHVYAIEWSTEKIDFYFDDQRYFTFQNEGTGADAWPFDQPFHVKLNIAVGGGWGGQKGIDESIFPQQFLIDYVRVYAPAR